MTSGKDRTTSRVAAPHLLLALLSGLALTVAHPPYGVGLVALLVPGLLVAAVDVATGAGRRSWPVPVVAAGVGFGIVLSWVIVTAGVIGWTLLVAIQVAWWSVMVAVIVRLPSRPSRAARPLLVGIAWVGMDAFRGIVPLNGFAWGTLGAATVDLPWLATLARLAGEKAMTLAVVVLSVAAWEAARGPLDASRDTSGRIQWRRVRETLPAGRTGAAWLGGAALVVTLGTVEPPPPTGEADVLLVQPNEFEQFRGTGTELDVAIADNAVALTRSAVDAAGVPDLTVWPESTIDADPGRVPALAEAMARGGELTQGRLLTGTILDGPRPRTFRNVVQSVGPTGDVTDEYQKRRLVPFGEYVPFRDYLDWFEPLEQVPRDAVAGDAAHGLTVADLRVAVVICFETLFGDLLRSNLRAGDQPAELVVAATNDASFGRRGEAPQHVAQSQLRALETGRWVAHAAISGTSAFVDPDGDVFDATDLFAATSIRRTVTTTDGLTPFLVTGDWLAPATMVGLVALAATGALSGRRRSRPEDAQDTP